MKRPFQTPFLKAFIILISIALIGACQSDSSSTALFATDDNAVINRNTGIIINVLENDSGISDTSLAVSILSMPSNGTAAVQNDNTITYQPNNDFYGIDSFTYKLTDSNNSIATATVTVSVTCDTCPPKTTITYSWDPNPDEEIVLGYKIYYGPTLATATTAISDVKINQAGFDKAAPSVQYDSYVDLNLYPDDPVCFRLKAYNSAGTSGYSTGICGVI